MSNTIYYGTLAVLQYTNISVYLSSPKNLNSHLNLFYQKVLGEWQTQQTRSKLGICLGSTLLAHTSVQKFKVKEDVLRVFGDNSGIILSSYPYNIHCGYSLEAPQWGASNEYSQCMFLWRSKKNYSRIIIYFSLMSPMGKQGTLLAQEVSNFPQSRAATAICSCTVHTVKYVATGE